MAALEGLAIKNDKTSSPKQLKFWLQTLAFSLIVLPQIGLYYSVTLGLRWATWILIGLIVAGMVIAIRVTWYTEQLGDGPVEPTDFDVL